MHLSHGKFKGTAFTLVVLALSACGGGSGGGSGDTDRESGEPSLTWTPPGGNATVAVDATHPFLQLTTSVDAADMLGVSQGRELFLAEWQAAPGDRALLDGLGPLFNANSCGACHSSDGRVAVLEEDGSTTAAILFRLGNAAGSVHPEYGNQLQSSATAGAAEGSVTWQVSTTTGAIEYIAEILGDSALDDFQLGPRISPQLVGVGLLDSVAQEQILEYADEFDSNNDGISGRAHWVTEEGLSQVGRFGWKAINATLRTQNAGAMHQDMGLTTPVNPDENCTGLQLICDAEPSGGSPEVSDASLTAIVDFMTVLGVPDRRISDQDQFDRGARLFESVGCASCHRPTLTSGPNDRFPSLGEQTLYAYTDLLLHDMGEALSDGIREKDAEPSEWRTPPLWSIGLVEQAAGARFLHDGRAASIPEAIEWHGGEASATLQRYQGLSASENADLLVFLRGI